MRRLQASIPTFRPFACMPLCAAALISTGVVGCDRGGGQPDTQSPDDALLDEELPEQDAVEKAGGLVMSGRAKAGLDAADEALTSDPNNAELHFVRGMALQALGQGEEAIAAWETALTHDPKMYAALDGIGTVHLDAGRLDEAKAKFEAALAIEPKFAGSHYNLGIIALSQGDLDAAAAAFTKVTEIDAEDADAWLELAAILEKQGKRDEARATVAKAVEVNPQNGFAQMVSGDIAAADGAPVDEVIAFYEKAVGAEPGLMEARLKLVRALRKAERPQDALVHSQFLVDNVPDQAILWSDHAGVLTDLGKTDDALAALDKALGIDPKLISGHRRKVLALAAAGRCKDAKAAAAAVAETGADKQQVDGAKADAKACKAK